MCSSDLQAGHHRFDAGVIALLIASAGPLALRRRHPVAVLAVTSGTTLIYFVLGYADGPIWLAPLIALLGGLFTHGLVTIAYWFVFAARGNYMYYMVHVKRRQIPI